MDVSVRASSQGKSASGAVSVAVPTGAQSGDLLVALHFTDIFGNTTGMTAPAGWVQSGTTYTGTTGSLLGKVWTKAYAGEAGPYSFGNPDTSVVIIACVTGHDTSTPVNITPVWGDGGTSQTAHVAPSVTPTVANALLICGYGSTVASGSPAYTPPSGMTEIGDSGSTGFAFAGAAAQVLSSGASVATGTKSATCSISNANAYTSVSLAIAPAVATTVTGALSGTLPALTGSASAAVTDSGAVAGTLPALTGSVSAAVTDAGALTGSLPALTASATADVFDAASLAGALSPLTGSVTATSITAGNLTAALPGLTGDLAGGAATSGTLAGALPTLTASLLSDVPALGPMSAALPAFTGALTGAARTSGALSGALPTLTGSLTGAPPRAIRVTVNGLGLSKAVTGPASVADPGVSGPGVPLVVTGPSVRRTVTGIGV